MGAIADKVATMRGCSLAQIVAEIARLEAEELIVPNADQWDHFWREYPHKVGKPAALKSYERALKRGHRHHVIMAGLKRYKDSKPPDRPWLNPATFLNQDRFNDEPAQVAAKPSKTSELRNDLRNRIGQRSEDPRPVRQLPQRQPIA